MPRYVAMLRGINVSGQKKIKMADLSAMCEQAGLKNVRTYVQSGNIVFDLAGTASSDVRGLIEKEIAQTFGFSAAVIVRTASALSKIAAANPYWRRKSVDEKHLYVTFLDTRPAKNVLSGLEPLKSGDDEVVVTGTEAYGYFPNGYGRSKLSNNFLENRLKVTATTRNWRTVQALLDLANNS